MSGRAEAARRREGAGGAPRARERGGVRYYTIR